MYTRMNRTESNPIVDSFSIADARRNLPALVREAERGKPIELTRRGTPVAVLMGRPSFERLVAKRQGFAASFADFAREFDLGNLALDPETLFRDARAKTPGRNVRL